MKAKKEPQVISFKTQEDFRNWLSKNYKLEEGIVIKMFKKDSGVKTISNAEALDVALCYGWIDGIRRGLDEKAYLQKYTPRRKRSIWSKINIGNVERLIKEKRMKAPGLKVYEEARQDGRLAAAYDSPKNMVIPEDFLKELDKNRMAKEFFKTLKKSDTFAIGFRLQTAKKEETRIKRIKGIIEMLEKHKSFN